MRTIPDNRLSRVIRARFQTSGLSIKQLSELSGVPYAGTHAFIRGKRDPVLSTAAKLCKVLGLELRVVRPSKQKGTANHGQNL